MNIADILDLNELEKCIAEGYVRATQLVTPDNETLTQYNYTPKAQFSNYWTPVTRQCRGLIIDESGMIVARPFPKFMNYGQERLPKTVDKPCITTDKLDGSMGVLFCYHHGFSSSMATWEYRIATRGSFASEQAKWATEHWLKNYSGIFPPPNHTALFEIIYKQNRIVVDYGDLEDLVLLAIIDNETGADLDIRDPANTQWWPGEVAKIYWDVTDIDTAYHLANSPEFNDSEGLVCCWLQHEAPSYRLKVKNLEYLRLHRIITGVSAKRLWEMLVEGRPIDEILDRVPDEFYNWVKNTSAELERKHTELLSDAAALYNEIKDELSQSCGLCDGAPHNKFLSSHRWFDGVSRKKFAQRVMSQKDVNFSLLFALHDGQEQKMQEIAWKMIKPEFERPFRVDEDSI